ncbi:MAG: acyl-CoA reductase [Hymenobacteraceae bacterium]|nr:acyl-CoA reductase [Hymenobacteraceae bacterium]MDX5397642.1 acyl-CoA reductase [Hymenobacteraceae bacterium]MDX5513720.1 acyl-CoA reductase [Hymenobacteraceae bacterium]
MTLEQRIKAFVALGTELKALTPEQLTELAAKAAGVNVWFDEPNVINAFNGIIALLDEQHLRDWLFPYQFNKVSPKKVGVVMAGNVPMVGFHDMMSVLLAGHTLLAKLSSDDPHLIKYLAQRLVEIEPRFADKIQFVDLLKEADAFIATGSDNTARYFEYYFSKKPHIIRKNRTSVAILTGHETKEELEALGHDVFQYYGLGCRNVAKVFVPEGYTFDKFYEAIEANNIMIEHHKYRNNYDYNKSILLVNRVPHFDNGFLLISESSQLVSPISVLHYETFKDQQDLKQKLDAVQEKLQVVVSSHGWYENSIPFGSAQCPMVWDYADGVDTMAFLLNL